MNRHNIHVGQLYQWNDPTAWSSDGQPFKRSCVVKITRVGPVMAYGTCRQGNQIAVIETQPEKLSPLPPKKH